MDISALLRLREKSKRKEDTHRLARVRVELTILALSAPRSADWANGPDMVKAAEYPKYDKIVECCE